MPECQLFLDLIRRICFGRIEGLAVRNGRPALDPPPRIVREIKLGTVAEQSDISDFASKPQVRELFVLFEAIGDGIVDCVEVRHGLPFRVVIADTVAGREES